MPAFAAYAAAAAEVLPVEAQMMALAFSSLAFDTAMVMPLSLKEPVGFNPSYFKRSLMSPKMSFRLSHSISGVFPSRRVVMASSDISGRKSLNSLIMPPQSPFLVSCTKVLLYPDIDYFVVYYIHGRYLGDRGPQFLHKGVVRQYYERDRAAYLREHARLVHREEPDVVRYLERLWVAKLHGPDRVLGA